MARLRGGCLAGQSSEVGAQSVAMPYEPASAWRSTHAHSGTRSSGRGTAVLTPAASRMGKRLRRRGRACRLSKRTHPARRKLMGHHATGHLGQPVPVVDVLHPRRRPVASGAREQRGRVTWFCVSSGTRVIDVTGGAMDPDDRRRYLHARGDGMGPVPAVSGRNVSSPGLFQSS